MKGFVYDLTRSPLPSVTVCGLSLCNRSHYWLEDRDVAKRTKDDGQSGLIDVAAELGVDYDLWSDAPPDEFPLFRPPIARDFCCPRCSYAWNGSPRPGAAEAESIND